MKIFALSLLALAGLAACTSTSSLAVAEGDGAGTVLVSYETSDLATPALSLAQANHLATRRCERMGYSYTELAVNVTQECASTEGNGACSSWQVQNAYQCAGNHVATPELPAAAPAPLRTARNFTP
ncbi:YecR family lipoprotein [Luteimonas sp. A534]